MSETVLRLEVEDQQLAIVDGKLFLQIGEAEPEELNISVILLIAPLIIKLLTDLDILKGNSWGAILETILSILSVLGKKE